MQEWTQGAQGLYQSTTLLSGNQALSSCSPFCFHYPNMATEPWTNIYTPRSIIQAERKAKKDMLITKGQELFYWPL